MTVAVWENERVVNGKKELIKSVQLSKRYTDKEGNWKNTNSMNINEIPKAISALQAAYDQAIKMEEILS